MKLASIVPINYLHCIKDDDYFMALAPIVLKSKEYADFFKARADEGKFVLLDNGAHEAGSLNILEIHEAAHLVNASEIILPDVLGDTAATLEATYRGFKHFRNLKDIGGVHNHKLMVVPQGANLEEWIRCYNMVYTLGCDSVGIPKLLTHRSGPSARWEAVEHILSFEWVPDIHLLGVWYDANELKMYNAHASYVRGVDSTLPYLYAREGRVFGDGDKPTKIMDPYDDKTSEVLLEANLYAWRQYGQV